MSSTPMTDAAFAPSAPHPLSVRARQARAIAALEIRKSLLGRRALVVYLLALAPVGLMALGAVGAVLESRVTGRPEPLTADVYSAMFQVFILRWCIFFGCAAVFMNLFRGEVIDRSLHHYFLAPVRREVLVAGKYGAGLLGAATLFCWATLISWLLSYVPLAIDGGVAQVVASLRWDHLLSYLLVTALAVMGYGALFLVIGVQFRNPILPALVILAWESIVFLLPPGLKHLSVVHYLEALMPLPMDEGPFAIVSEPASPVVAIAGLTLFSAALVLFAARKVRAMEISYPT
ncbi:MAG: hypothetical protein ACK2T6_08190 [Anaerolineae bacterium]|jgi:ABC-type transport system involved in multi-copper enzyme maturation permease subunit